MIKKSLMNGIITCTLCDLLGIATHQLFKYDKQPIRRRRGTAHSLRRPHTRLDDDHSSE